MPVGVYRFGEFSLDCGKFELCRKARRLKLERKPLELLVLLVTKHGQVVSREEIAGRLWGQEVFVDIEHGINTAVRKIRKTLGDSTEMPQFVQTVSGSGYRFIGTVTADEPEVAAPLPPAPEITPAPPEAAAASPSSTTRSPSKTWFVPALVGGSLLVASIFVLSLHSWITRFLDRHNHATIGSIAVLPLQNLSGDPSQAFFADGMTDELITELARIPNLRVVSRTSVMAERNSGRSLTEIAQKLDVDAIVEGSIVRSGNRIRITAQLIDGRTDRHLWAQSFEGSASDVLAIQDSVAAQIAAQARLVLAVPTTRPPVDPAAHDAYLRGRYFFNKQDFRHSTEYYEQAIALDPTYASAYAGYSTALDAATTYGIGTPDSLIPKAVSAAQRAIELDPQNGEAFTELGSIQTIYAWDWVAAEQNLRRGIALNPSDSIAEFKYSSYLDAVDRTQEAVAHMRRAVQLDPGSFIINRRLGVALFYDRQYDAALAQLERAAEMESSPGSIEHWASRALEEQGRRDEAVRRDLIALHAEEPQIDTAALARTHQQNGWNAYWRDRSSAVRKTSTSPCKSYEIGVGELRVNDLGPAFESFQRATDNHCFLMAFIRADPLFDAVRNDSRYADLLRRLHQ